MAEITSHTEWTIEQIKKNIKEAMKKRDGDQAKLDEDIRGWNAILNRLNFKVIEGGKKSD